MRYYARRLVSSAVTLFIIVTLVFVLFRLLPGNAALYIAGVGYLPPDVIQHLEAQFGLDQPIYVQYFVYLSQLAQGNLGYSFYYVRPVTEVLIPDILNSMMLALTALIVSYGIAVPLGTVLAFKRGTKIERLGMSVLIILRSIPTFWLGIVLLFVFAGTLGIFPLGSVRSPGSATSNLLASYLSTDFLWHLTLPALTYSAYIIGLPTLLLRTTLLDEISKDYIEFLRAQGLKESSVRYVHALKNAIIPVITDAAIFIGIALGGQIVIEYIFSWPGIGREIVLAIQRRDYPMAQGAFLIIAIAVIVVNFLADMVYTRIDPRIRFQED